MKKHFVIGTAILLITGMATAANSPIDKGSLYLNGSFYVQTLTGNIFDNELEETGTAYGLGNGDIRNSYSLEVAPAVGYFVAPGWFVGAQFSVLGVHQEGLDMTQTVVGPTVGYFFNLNPQRTQVKGAAYPYIRGFFNYGHGTGSYDVDIYQYGLRGGLLYMLSSAVAADAAVRFQKDRWERDYYDFSTKGTRFTFGVGITAFIY